MENQKYKARSCCGKLRFGRRYAHRYAPLGFKDPGYHNRRINLPNGYIC
jgi:hypothetical protein